MLGICKMSGKQRELPCPAAGCPLFGDCIVDYEKATKKPQTNADRIRAMSDEELAWAIDPAIVPPGTPKLEWLKQPAEV